MARKKFDIHERLYGFVLGVLKFLRKLGRSQENLVIIDQISRSATSVGANDQEAKDLLDEGGELTKIVSKIIDNARRGKR